VEEGVDKGRGNKYMEVNVRAVYRIRAISAGHKQLEKFCIYMNMPVNPWTFVPSVNRSGHLRDAVRSVAEKSTDSVIMVD